MQMKSSDLWTVVGSVVGSLFVLVSMIMHQRKVVLCINKVAAYLNPYIQITIPEYGPERLKRSDFFVAIETYLSENCATTARKLKADLGSDRKEPHAYVDDEQEIMDTFEGATLWWYAYKEERSSKSISLSPDDDERRFYRVRFHRNFRGMVLHSYLPYVLEQGRAVNISNRQRRLFTNNPSSGWSYGNKAFWSHVEFKHPATFETLAMDPADKKAIMDELDAFKDAKGYYKRVGKAWKRGYLLFGPPGTGKSTMIAAMANYLGYDIYDLELTAVHSNTELRKLFIETTGKSIMVIEDIDCSVDLTGKRKPAAGQADRSDDNNIRGMPKPPGEAKEDGQGTTKMTLSGVLNFIDGLWSSCGGDERIIIFTTNNKGKLDPALIRRGRMDRHIEMSYCRYEAFKVLANNYLNITDHAMFEQFGEIQQLLEEVDMSPADVAENLMSMPSAKADPSASLTRLVVALKKLQGGKGHQDEGHAR